MSHDPGGISAEGRVELARVTSRGRRLVDVGDVAETLELDRSAAAKRLARWASRGWLRRVRRGLYLAVPVDVEHPETWTEDPLILADEVWSPCYFTGWTSAQYWHLTDQIFRTVVVKTTRRVRSSDETLLDQDYLIGHVPSSALEWGLKATWIRERRVQMADPARTVIDVLDEPELGGGIRHVSEILESFMLDRPEPGLLLEYGDWLGNRTVFKRLGYLLETLDLGDEELRRGCRSRISTGISLLDPSGSDRGERISDWNLRANIDLGPRERS